MGEFTDKLKGAANQVAGQAKQGSADPNVRAEGDAQKAQEYENTAEAFAAQLVTAEQEVEDLKAMHDQALQQAAAAKQAVERNSMQLQQKVNERTKLLSQLEQAKMQEQVSASLKSMSELTAPGNTPSLNEIRDKIERRYANALGSAELTASSVEGRMMEVEKSTMDMAGASRLEAIRAQLHPELAGQQARAIDPSAVNTPSFDKNVQQQPNTTG